MQGTDGAFYGTTGSGGFYNEGTVFRIEPSGKFTVLYNFDGTHGANPGPGPLIQASDGNFYGVTTNGGLGDCAQSNPCGVAFRITPTGMLTVLHNFTGGSDGENEVGGLIQATDGNLYGTNNIGGPGGFAAGVLFRITLAGTFTVLHDFFWDSGGSPQATLVQHTNGVLYGTTAVGGIGNGGDGTFYSFDIGLDPFVTFVTATGKPGDIVEVLGQDFTGATAVSFNGTSASFTVFSDTYLLANVPHNAKTGFVTVTTPGGTLTSNKRFLVIRGLPRPGRCFGTIQRGVCNVPLSDNER